MEGFVLFMAIVGLLANGAVAKRCTNDDALQVAEAHPTIATPFCDDYLKSKHYDTNNLPGPLSDRIHLVDVLSSVCSCILHPATSSSVTATSSSAPLTTSTSTGALTSASSSASARSFTSTASTLPSSFLTCPPASTATVTISGSNSICAATASTVTVSVTATITASGKTATATDVITDKITASAATVTDIVTDNITASGKTVTATVTATITASGKTATATATDFITDQITASCTTVTDTVTISVPVTPAPVTDTVTITAPATTVSNTVTVTAPGTTVTATVTNIPSEAVDQSGCPAVNGDTSFEYVIYCNQGAGPGSFAAATNPGYNFEDCASQCFDNPDGIDCLGVTYTAPAVPFSGFDGHLNPGTCTFYEFVTSAVPATGVVLGVFENTFAR